MIKRLFNCDGVCLLSCQDSVVIKLMDDCRTVLEHGAEKYIVSNTQALIEDCFANVQSWACPLPNIASNDAVRMLSLYDLAVHSSDTVLRRS